MSKPKRSHIREERIRNEAVVDAYGPEEQAMAPEDACTGDMLVLIRWQSRNLPVRLSQIAAIDADESTSEAIGDWHYWVAQGYCF